VLCEPIERTKLTLQPVITRKAAIISTITTIIDILNTAHLCGRQRIQAVERLFASLKRIELIMANRGKSIITYNCRKPWSAVAAIRYLASVPVCSRVHLSREFLQVTKHNRQQISKSSATMKEHKWAGMRCIAWTTQPILRSQRPCKSMRESPMTEDGAQRSAISVRRGSDSAHRDLRD
jgi:hypothetical protein